MKKTLTFLRPVACLQAIRGLRRNLAATRSRHDRWPECRATNASEGVNREGRTPLSVRPPSGKREGAKHLEPLQSTPKRLELDPEYIRQGLKVVNMIWFAVYGDDYGPQAKEAK
jgi:hypothetical protein